MSDKVLNVIFIYDDSDEKQVIYYLDFVCLLLNWIFMMAIAEHQLNLKFYFNRNIKYYRPSIHTTLRYELQIKDKTIF